jgi:hypothetical protein
MDVSDGNGSTPPTFPARSEISVIGEGSAPAAVG